MTNEYINANDTLWDITTKYPETIPVFVSQGFNQMEDESKRKAFGSSISLKTALSLKKYNIDTFMNALTERIRQEHNLADSSLRVTKKEDYSPNAIRVEGLLPCPVRLPLMEQFQSFVTHIKETKDIEIHHELKAASMGHDWLIEFGTRIQNPENLPDIIISAGFDLFFDENKIGKYKKMNAFTDHTGFTSLNTVFDNEKIDLKDPLHQYSMIAAVPAILVVNLSELNGRPIPQSWKDLLDPQFEKSVSLPIADFDLFNAILVNIHKNYGEEGVRNLGRTLLESMHPSQMVKSNNKKIDKPCVTVMPYFFTKMIKDGGPMKAVWPEDGAIISPVFMLTRTDRINELKPVIDFFASKEVGEIMAHKGLMPSTNPEIDNRIPEGKTFMWPGWDYINSHNIGELLEYCRAIFEGKE